MRTRRPRTSRPLALGCACLAACSGETQEVRSTGGPVADVVVPPPGVAARGGDPAVVAVAGGDGALCGGVLVAPDVVLTAFRCVVSAPWVATASGAGPRACSGDAGPLSLRPATSLRVLTGDDARTPQGIATPTAVLTPPGVAPCGADIAALVLATPVGGVEPLAARPTGAALGDHLRTVGFGAPGGPRAGLELVRDHVLVTGTTDRELALAEACDVTPGGAAIDEATGELVGIGSRPGGGLACGGAAAFDVYTRVDALLSFVEQAVAASAVPPTRGGQKEKKGPVDVGAECASAADCAAGVCVTEGAEQYCSRSCGAHDRCPPHFRCQKTENAAAEVDDVGEVCAQQ